MKQSEEETQSVQRTHDRQLREDSILIPGPNNLSTQKRVRGSRVRFWQLTSESFVETAETMIFTEFQKNRTPSNLTSESVK